MYRTYFQYSLIPCANTLTHRSGIRPLLTVVSRHWLNSEGNGETTLLRSGGTKKHR